ncbi:MAG TPA: hypothetical protein VMS74_08110 [Acidimicrobiia bacterium]|nr:hypothetical protein [Acidimicrobiia bacterium]
MTDAPRYLIVGGDIYDKVAAAEDPELADLLVRALAEIRRRPTDSVELDVERSRGWGTSDSYVGQLGRLHISYRVVDQLWMVFVIEVLW